MKKRTWKGLALVMVSIGLTADISFASPIYPVDYSSSSVDSWTVDQLAMDVAALKGGLISKISINYNYSTPTSRDTNDTSVENLLPPDDSGMDSTSSSQGVVLFAPAYDDLSVTTNGQAAPVPEPTVMMMLGVGLLGLGFCGKRKDS